MILSIATKLRITPRANRHTHDSGRFHLRPWDDTPAWQPSVCETEACFPFCWCNRSIPVSGRGSAIAQAGGI